MPAIRIPSGSSHGSQVITSTSSSTNAAANAPAMWDYILKFILIGDSSVGKSSLLVRLTDDRFLADPDPTIGVEFGSHLIRLDNGETVKVQVWDTAGSESFRSITRSYYRGAAGALLVYDITHRPSFLNAKTWLDDVRSHAEEKVTIVLVGNMSDLVDDQEPSDSAVPSAETITPSTPRRSERRRGKGKKREVGTQEAREFAQKEGLLFIETSAKTGYNVQEAFAQAAKDIHSKFAAAEAAGDDSAISRKSRTRARTGKAPDTVTLDSSSLHPATATTTNTDGSSSTLQSRQGYIDRTTSCCIIA